jgi:GntR family transcriptional regulator
MSADRFPYQRVLDGLRRDIESGSLPAGEQLPSESDLAGAYETSRNVVRRALSVLRAEGLITTGQGQRATVRPRVRVGITVTGSNYRRHRGLGLPGFNAQALEQGQRPLQVIREVARVGAPSEVATRLDVEEGAPVIVRRRTFLLEEIPAALTDSYYPADMAGGTAIEQPVRIKGGVHALIEDPGGPIRRQVACSVDDITGRMPTPDEARELRLPPGVPVFRVLRTVYDTEGRPLEVQDSVAAADRHQFRYEVEMR